MLLYLTPRSRFAAWVVLLAAVALSATLLHPMPEARGAAGLPPTDSLTPAAIAARAGANSGRLMIQVAPAVKGPEKKARKRAQQPGGKWGVFANKRILVAYYGSAGSGTLGVLGSRQPPAKIIPQLRKAAQPFGATGRPVQPVFELIVTIAHRTPSQNGDYSGDISKKAVKQYLRVAKKHNIIVILDLQPGRADFLKVAKRWRWALKKPWVGLALDPEWRMGPREIPGTKIGSVGAREINRVSRWLNRLTKKRQLPQKILMLHQFRHDMIRNPDAIKQRKHLAIIQHADGFGTQGQKLDTYHAIARPKQFRQGFKLFYKEDTNLFSPERVLKIRPRVDFVSYQ